jgi:hypothetical protein
MFTKTKTISNGYLYKVKTNLEACYFTQLHAHYALVPTCCQKEQIRNFRTVSFPQCSILPKAGVGSKLGSTRTITLEKSITESSGGMDTSLLNRQNPNEVHIIQKSQNHIFALKRVRSNIHLVVLPLITCPNPILNLNGCCPGSLVLQFK